MLRGVSDPAISVVIPTYRSPATIGRVVSTVIEQLGPHDEVVVVDDGSGDDTPEILAAIDDDRLRVMVQDNTGVAKARNRGAAAASNDLLVFLDDDEVPEPGWLEAHRRAHPPGSRKVVMGRAALVVPHRGGTRLIPPSDRHPGRLVNDSFSLRKNDFDVVDGFDPRYVHGGEDVELGLRLEAVGVELDVAPDAVIRHEIDRSYDEFRRRNTRVGEASARLFRDHGLRLLPERDGLHPLDRLLTSLGRRRGLVARALTRGLWVLVRLAGWLGSWRLQAACARRAALVVGFRAEARASRDGVAAPPPRRGSR